MLIAVLGSSGLDPVAGVPVADPAGLLQVDRATRAGHVLLLAPWYLEPVAKEQAHVLIAAAPRTRVAVLSPRHHPLTLTLAGALARQVAGPQADPGLVVGLLRSLLARSRSLVWYPKVGGLREPAPTAGQRLASLFGSPGWFREIATEPALVRARCGSPVGPTQEVYAVRGSHPLLHRHLGGAVVREVPVELEPRQPYATRSSVPLTLLGGVTVPPGGEPPCPSCGARLVAGGCAFCGHATTDERRTPAMVGQG